MNNNKPVLLCDIGNVLLWVRREHTWGSLGELLDLSADRIRALLADHHIHQELELGLITPEDFLQTMLDTLNRPGVLTLDQLVDSMGKSFYKNTELVEIIDRYRKHMRIVLLSNTNAVDMQAIEDRFSLVDWADAAVLSFRIHLRKPDPAIYRHTIEHHRLPPERTLFIDDLPENVESAGQIGLQAAVYDSPRQVEQLIRDLLNEDLQG